MAVALKINNSIVDSNVSINFFELTGAYNVVSNITGWGAPNSLTTDATTAKLYITLPKATVPIIINIFPTYPTTNTALAYNITPAALGLGATAVLPDGVYSIQYIVTGSTGGVGFTYTATETFVIIAATQCCVDKMFLALDPCGCACGDSKLMQAFWAEALLEQASAAACCGQIDNFNTLLAQVNKICIGNCLGC